MRKLLCIILLTMATVASAATYSVDNLPIPYLKDKTQYVSNPDNILSASTVDSLNVWLRRMERDHDVQTVLAVVERVEGGEVYDFCMALGRKYGIGSKEKNTGLIILLATEDRAYYILTGRGLEGTLPDAICKRIENHQMLPSLREGDWDEAMLNTVRAITQYIDGDDSLVGSSDFVNEEDQEILEAFLEGLLIFGAGIGFIVFAMWLENRKKAYCPSCHKYKMKKIGGTVTKKKHLNIRTHHDSYKCANCGFTKEIHWDEDLTSGSSTAAASSYGGSSFSSRGSSFSGGHFGGGSFGGGGAGGRF